MNQIFVLLYYLGEGKIIPLSLKKLLITTITPLIKCVGRCNWRRCGNNNGVRLQANVQRCRYHGHRVRSLENGHSACMGRHRTVSVDHRHPENDETVAEITNVGRSRGNGVGSGGRCCGYVGGRRSVAVPQGQTGREHYPGHQAYGTMLRKFAGSYANAREQDIRAALGRTRQPSCNRTAHETQK
jgi:hypothetical protein